MAHDYDPKGSDETTNTTNVGALADGFANSAINSTEVDEGATGYVGGVANGDNRNNSDSSVDVDVDAKVDIAANNGDNRDNDYDWSYDSKSYSNTETDTDIKTVTDTDTDIKTVSDSYNSSETDYDWSYDSKSYSNTETDTDIKTVTETDTDIDTDIKTVTETSTATNSFNSADSDDDFATLDDVKDFGNLGIAGGDLTFNLGDDFSFTLNVDNILNDALTGAGNDAGFSAVQANHLADQDLAYDVRMENGGAQNYLSANAAEADSGTGVEMDGKTWDLKAGDDVAGSSTADASAILANSGFHFEFVQGANLLTNSIDSSVVGNDTNSHSVGEDADS